MFAHPYMYTHACTFICTHICLQSICTHTEEEMVAAIFLLLKTLNCLKKRVFKIMEPEKYVSNILFTGFKGNVRKTPSASCTHMFAEAVFVRVRFSNIFLSFFFFFFGEIEPCDVDQAVSEPMSSLPQPLEC